MSDSVFATLEIFEHFFSHTLNLNIASRPNRQRFIIGGEEIGIHRAPYQVSLRFEGRHFCGGTILTNRHCLTASHCREPSLPLKDHSVAVGSKFRANDRTAFITGIKRFITHERFVLERLLNDVALLVLTKPLPLNSKTIVPIRLPPPNAQLKPGTPVNVTGW